MKNSVKFLPPSRDLVFIGLGADESGDCISFTPLGNIPFDVVQGPMIGHR